MANTIQSKSTIKGNFGTGDTPTGDQFDNFISSTITMGSDTNVNITTAGDITLTVADGTYGPGKTFVYDYSGDVTFNLPSVDGTNVGIWYQIVNISGAKLTVQAADSDTIDDSDPGATIYNGDSWEDMSSSDNSGWEVPMASVKVQLISATQWHVLHGRKTWTTTQFV